MYKKLISIITCALNIIMLFGCGRLYKGYTGEYPQLFTVAVNSIPDAKGYIFYEIRHQPAISLIDEDSQGRLLFCYCEQYNRDAIMYLMVCQSADGKSAYYYENAYTFSTVSGKVSARIKLYGTKFPSKIVSPMLDFTNEQVEALKEENDWNQELNIDKCTKAPIIRKLKSN